MEIEALVIHECFICGAEVDDLTFTYEGLPICNDAHCLKTALRLHKLITPVKADK